MISSSERIIKKFGGQTALAEAIGTKQSTVQYWLKTGVIPSKWHTIIVSAAQKEGIAIHISEFMPPRELQSQRSNTLPFAKWKGQIDLVGDALDCYVLDTEQRVISLSATMRAIANVDTGKLGDYIGSNSLKPFIDKDKIIGELLEFSIPGGSRTALGLTTEHFELICRGYVQALYKGEALTERQKEIAIKCAVLTSGLTRTGLDALIDEATGYQYERAEDALQVKLKAFIAEELRAWEKTFPDELWEEFGRLTNWQTPLQTRPKWWGKLVIEMVYDTLDTDVAEYLKSNKPDPTVRWHQQLTENIGVRQLVSRCYEIIGMAKTCKNIKELRQKVAEHYGKKPVQFTMYL